MSILQCPLYSVHYTVHSVTQSQGESGLSQTEEMSLELGAATGKKQTEGSTLYCTVLDTFKGQSNIREPWT